VEAADKAVLDRIGAGREDDRYRRGHGLGCDRRKNISDYQRDQPTGEISRQSNQPIRIIFCCTILDHDVLPLDIADFLQALTKRVNEMWGVGDRRAAKKTDPRHYLLRARRERPSCRAAQQRDERATPHSITSSASASSLSGIARPSVFAVLRLITSWNFIDCTTGRSAGLSPLSTRPVYTPTRRYASEASMP